MFIALQVLVSKWFQKRTGKLVDFDLIGKHNETRGSETKKMLLKRTFWKSETIKLEQKRIEFGSSVDVDWEMEMGRRGTFRGRLQSWDRGSRATLGRPKLSCLRFVFLLARTQVSARPIRSDDPRRTVGTWANPLRNEPLV